MSTAEAQARLIEIKKSRAAAQKAIAVKIEKARQARAQHNKSLKPKAIRNDETVLVPIGKPNRRDMPAIKASRTAAQKAIEQKIQRVRDAQQSTTPVAATLPAKEPQKETQVVVKESPVMKSEPAKEVPPVKKEPVVSVTQKEPVAKKEPVKAPLPVKKAPPKRAPPKKVPPPLKKTPPAPNMTPSAEEVIQKEMEPKPVEPIVEPKPEQPSKYGDIMFFWINLDRAPERRESMESQLNSRKIPNERVVAVDAKDSLQDYVPAGWKNGAMKTYRAEIATTLSHLKAVQAFVKSGHPYGVICEDDVLFEYEPHWPYTLKEVIEGAPKGWEVMQLSITLGDQREWARIMKLNKRYHQRKRGWFSAVSYAITRQHAINTLNRNQIPHTGEFSCKLKGNISRMQSEVNIIGIGPHRLTLYPPMFTYPTDNTSYIHPHHVNGHRNSKRLVSTAYPNYKIT